MVNGWFALVRPYGVRADFLLGFPEFVAVLVPGEPYCLYTYEIQLKRIRRVKVTVETGIGPVFLALPHKSSFAGGVALDLRLLKGLTLKLVEGVLVAPNNVVPVLGPEGFLSGARTSRRQQKIRQLLGNLKSTAEHTLFFFIKQPCPGGVVGDKIPFLAGFHNGEALPEDCQGHALPILVSIHRGQDHAQWRL